jgi:hypothetical protein
MCRAGLQAKLGHQLDAALLDVRSGDEIDDVVERQRRRCRMRRPVIADERNRAAPVMLREGSAGIWVESVKGRFPNIGARR